MNRLYSILAILMVATLIINCKSGSSSDDFTLTPPRDSKEVYTENAKQIEDYLKNNYMVERNGIISFDSITSPNHTNEQALIDNPNLKSIIVSNEDYAAFSLTDPYDRSKIIYKYGKSADTVKYKIYYLIINEGAGEKSSPVDSIFVKRINYSLKNERVISDNHPSEAGFYSFPHTIAELRGLVPSPLRMNTGERQMLQLIKTSTEAGINPDGTINYDVLTAGRIIAFIPSGLGQFNIGYSSLKAYTPYIADLTLISAFERDHDRDGILSKHEVEPNKIGQTLTIHDYFALDTDKNGVPNFLDEDDDGDAVPTKIELMYKEENGRVRYYKYDAPQLKTCGDTPRYLDINCRPYMVDGEWVYPAK